MGVCPDCSTFGTKEHASKFDSSQQFPEKPRTIFETEEDLAPGYGKIIRDARAKKNLTVEELARKVFEMASFMHRVENESIRPGIGLAKKIEKALGVEIIERKKG